MWEGGVKERWPAGGQASERKRLGVEAAEVAQRGGGDLLHERLAAVAGRSEGPGLEREQTQ